MAGFSLLPFALSLGIALFITGERIFGFSAGLAAGCFFALLALGCWYGLQYLRRLQTGHKEGAISARQQTVMETTPLDERITQMLTEARVVLPGVQALLGFQLASVISQSFERLPASSKTVHAASLGCIAVAVILLIAPAAYHRIVFSGQDTEEVHRFGSWLVTCATAPLALGLSGDLYVVLTEITASAMVGAFTASFTLVFLVGLWHLFPAVSSGRGGCGAPADPSGRGDIGKNRRSQAEPPRGAQAVETDRPWVISPSARTSIVLHGSSRRAHIRERRR
jgi:hypothetical protein